MREWWVRILRQHLAGVLVFWSGASTAVGFVFWHYGLGRAWPLVLLGLLLYIAGVILEDVFTWQRLAAQDARSTFLERGRCAGILRAQADHDDDLVLDHMPEVKLRELADRIEGGA